MQELPHGEGLVYWVLDSSVMCTCLHVLTEKPHCCCHTFFTVLLPAVPTVALLRSLTVKMDRWLVIPVACTHNWNIMGTEIPVRNGVFKYFQTARL